MNKSKKYLSVFLSVLMVLAVFPTSGLTAYAEFPCEHTDADSDNICDNCMRTLYIDRELNAADDAVVSTLADIPMGSAILTSETSELEAGKLYVLDGDVEINGRITASGTPDNPSRLILLDNCTLKADAGIGVGDGRELRIYGQSGDSGKIIAAGSEDNSGIGGARRENCGKLVICGGDISASGGERGAGIGGGSTGGGGNVIILGGKVKAFGSTRSAGIGGGYNSHGGTVTVYGGTVSATGGENGEGIGGYCYAKPENHGTLRAYGGDVTASGGDYSSGIGHNVKVYGGKIKAVGNKYGAGIGGGYTAGGVSFLMYDGTVEAFGGEGGAGIGGGCRGSGEIFEIHGGTVSAYGGSYAAGIGGGGSFNQTAGFQGASGGTVKMYGGNVTAVGGYGGSGVGGGPTGAGGSVTVYGGSLTAKGDYGSAAIGGGYTAPGGSFTIYDGTVFADGGNLSAGIGGGFEADGGSFRMIGGKVEAVGKNAPGIGGGRIAQDNGSFIVTAVAELKSGSAAPGSYSDVEAYGTSRDSYVCITGHCGHPDSDGDRVCDYCEKELYIDRKWDTDKKAVVDTMAAIPDSAVIINGDIDTLDPGKFYVIDGNIKIKHSVTVNGDVILVLKDNCSLTIANGLPECGLIVEEGSALSVYAQSDGEKAGRLYSAGYRFSAGIGGNNSVSGDIDIYGGNVTAVGGQFAAGIGGGHDGSCGNVNIYGGTVEAVGGDAGAGIGCGSFSNGGKVKIYGGTVITAGGYFGAGIGGGKESSGGDVTFFGGRVIASCGVYSNILGHGSAEDPHIWLENGTVSAGEGTTLYNGKNGTVITPSYGSYHSVLNNESFYDSDGFGSICIYADTGTTAQNRVSYLEYDPETGKTENKSVSENRAFPADKLNEWSVQWLKADGNVTVDGPITVSGNVNLILTDNCVLTVKEKIYVEADSSLTIYAQSTGEAMGRLIAEKGIGSGSENESGTIIVHGGDITASGETNASAIGGGYRGGAGTVIIYDGKVTAEGGENAAGIGCGSLGRGGNVEIYGGTVIADGNSGADGISADSIAVYDAQVTVNGIPFESAHMHHLIKVSAKDATCTETGISTTYYICTGDHACGKLFSDPDGKNELTAEQVSGYVIDALGHSFTSGEYLNNNNGTHSEKCIRCNESGPQVPHNIVNGKCTECSYCEHRNITVSYTWDDDYARCKASKKCTDCNNTLQIEFTWDISFVEDTPGKDCQTPGKGHYEAVFEYFDKAKTAENGIETKYGGHNYVDYICEYCGDELFEDAKADAIKAIHNAVDNSEDTVVKLLAENAEAIIHSSQSVADVLYAWNYWLTAINKQISGTAHEHTFSTEYSKNGFAHWYAAACGHDVVTGFAEHTFDEGTTEGGKTTYTCTVCGYEKVEGALTLADIIGKVSGTYGGTMSVVGATVTMTIDADGISTELIASEWARKTAVDADGASEWYTESFENGQPVYPAEPTGGDEEETIDKYLNTAITITEEAITVGDNIAVPAGSYVLDDILIFYNEQNGEIQEIFLNGAALKRINETQHEHTFDTEYSNNEFVHWYAAACEHTDLTKGMAVHTFDEGTIKDGKMTYTCTVCGYEKGEDEIKTALENTRKALEEAQAALSEKTAALNTAEAQIAAAETALSEAQTALDEKTSALTDTQAKLSASEAALETAKNQVTTLTGDLEQAQSDLAAANKQVTDLTADLKKANDELAETKTALDKAEADLETAKTEKANLETQLADKETELENLRKSGEAKDEEISALEEEIAGLEKAIETKDGEITEKTNAIAALEKSVDELEKAVEDKDKELAEKSDAVKALEKSVADLENAVKDKEDEIAEKEKTIGDLEKSISNLEASVQAKETEVAEKTEEIKNLQNSVKDLEDEIDKAQKDLADKNSQIEELTEQLEKAKVEIEELKNGSGEQEDEPCPKCGKFHKDNFWGKIVCFFNRIFNFFRDLFQKIF